MLIVLSNCYTFPYKYEIGVRSTLQLLIEFDYSRYLFSVKCKDITGRSDM